MQLMQNSQNIELTQPTLTSMLKFIDSVDFTDSLIHMASFHFIQTKMTKGNIFQANMEIMSMTAEPEEKDIDGELFWISSLHLMININVPLSMRMGGAIFC